MNFSRVVRACDDAMTNLSSKIATLTWREVQERCVGRLSSHSHDQAPSKRWRGVHLRVEVMVQAVQKACIDECVNLQDGPHVDDNVADGKEGNARVD